MIRKVVTRERAIGLFQRQRDRDGHHSIVRSCRPIEEIPRRALACDLLCARPELGDRIRGTCSQSCLAAALATMKSSTTKPLKKNPFMSISIGNFWLASLVLSIGCVADAEQGVEDEEVETVSAALYGTASEGYILSENEVLLWRQSMFSPNGKVRLTMQRNGDLVLRHLNRVLWRSGTQQVCWPSGARDYCQLGHVTSLVANDLTGVKQGDFTVHSIATTCQRGYKFVTNPERCDPPHAIPPIFRIPEGCVAGELDCKYPRFLVVEDDGNLRYMRGWGDRPTSVIWESGTHI